MTEYSDYKFEDSPAFVDTFDERPWKIHPTRKVAVASGPSGDHYFMKQGKLKPMQLLPIHPTATENAAFANHTDCRESVGPTLDFYQRVGFEPPWIGYFAQIEDKFVGAAGFKGPPQNGQVEIAYGTFPAYQHQGIGTQMCRALVQLALEADPTIRITARTLPEENYSTKILRKNGFIWVEMVWEEEDGDIWEWLYNA